MIAAERSGLFLKFGRWGQLRGGLRLLPGLKGHFHLAEPQRLSWPQDRALDEFSVNKSAIGRSEILDPDAGLGYFEFAVLV